MSVTAENVVLEYGITGKIANGLCCWQLILLLGDNLLAKLAGNLSMIKNIIVYRYIS